MLEFTEQLHKELLFKLEELDRNNKLKYYTPEERRELIVLAIDRLKVKLKTYHFKDEEEEIYFFKYLMPQFLSLYIHDQEKIILDLVMFVNIYKMKRSYLNIFYQRMSEFFQVNEDFINYCHANKTDLDQYYFLCADNFREVSMDMITKTMDLSINMVQCVTVATMLAYYDLKPYVEQLEREMLNELDGEPVRHTGLVWTDSKTDLTELVYCFKEAGSFNCGEVDVKQIAEYFEYVFSVELGNTSSTFQKIISRKKGQTSYIDKLRNHINRKIDDMDENRTL